MIMYNRKHNTYHRWKRQQRLRIVITSLALLIVFFLFYLIENRVSL